MSDESYHSFLDDLATTATPEAKEKTMNHYKIGWRNRYNAGEWEVLAASSDDAETKFREKHGCVPQITGIHVKDWKQIVWRV